MKRRRQQPLPASGDNVAVFTKHSHAPPVPRSYLHFRPRTGTAGSGGLLPPPGCSALHRAVPGAGAAAGSVPPGLEELPAQSPSSRSQAGEGRCIPKPQLVTSPGSQAVSEHPPRWLLTILQRPLDVTCAFTHCVKVSIQSGYEEQCFWDSHSAAFEALRTETLPLGSRARLGDEPPQPGLSHTAQQTPLSPARHGSRLRGRAPGSLLVPSEARLGRKIIYFLAPAY